VKFTNPNALWGLLALPLLGLLWMAAGRDSAKKIASLVAKRLSPVLVGEASGRFARFVFLLLGAGLSICALGRPQWGQTTTETKGKGRDVIILVDVSRSMLAADLPPSRLQRAKLAAEDLVRQLPADRIGLVAFAGSAFLQAPVTADHAAVLAAIRELDPEIIPLPGTNISGALHCADEAFDRTEGGQRALVLITDGEELEEDAVALSRELSQKMRIFTVGVGSPEGSVLSIPSPRGGTEYIRDGEGNVVQSKLDEGRLLQIAEAGGGFYTRLVSGPAEMKHIAMDGIESMAEHDVMTQNQTHAVERFQWPLAAGVFFLTLGMFLGERPRRRAATILAVLLAAVPGEGEGAVNAGNALYDSGDYAGAQRAFTEELSSDPGSPRRAFNLGVAAYKNQKWAEAIDAFGKALASQDPQLRSRAEYNLANTLVQQARQGRRGQDNKALEQAISHYDEATRRDPLFEDAAHNKEFVRKLLEQKEQQQQKGKDGSKDKNKSDKDKEEKDKNQQENKDGDSKDGDQDKERPQKDGKDGKEGKDGDEQKSQDSSGKEGNQQGDEKGQSKDQNKQANNGNQPEPVEEKPGEEKERGELKDSPLVDRPEKGDKKGEESKTAEGGNSKMTKDQAAALLEALRSEDRRVQVWAPNKPEAPSSGARASKTW
jgi:Ca-activated chloride channel family protein